jgi:hypothetical protein
MPIAGSCSSALVKRIDSQLAAPHLPLPSMQDCHDCANHCLDMWNNSVDHAERSCLLRLADAWLQLASELDEVERNWRSAA